MGDDEPFYLTPVRKVKDYKIWYTKVPVGHNTLGNVVKICAEMPVLKVSSRTIRYGLQRQVEV